MTRRFGKLSNMSIFLKLCICRNIFVVFNGAENRTPNVSNLGVFRSFKGKMTMLKFENHEVR